MMYQFQGLKNHFPINNRFNQTCPLLFRFCDEHRWRVAGRVSSHKWLWTI